MSAYNRYIVKYTEWPLYTESGHLVYDNNLADRSLEDLNRMKDTALFLLGLIFIGIAVEPLITGEILDESIIKPITYDGDPVSFIIYIVVWLFIGVACLHDSFKEE